MKQNSNPSAMGVILIYILFGIALLFLFDGTYSEDETALFIELMASYIWTAGLLIYAKLFFRLYIFEPLFFIGVLYELIFVVKPLIDLKNHNMVEHGINVFAGGEKATALFTLGFTILFLAYYGGHAKEKTKMVLPNDEEKEDETPEGKSLILYIAWFVVYGLCLISMFSQGLSLKYIFSLGSGGERITDSDNVALLFLTNFGITLITLWLMIIVKTKNMAIKMLITLLCIVYLLMRNARWLVLVFIASPIVYYYVKRRKSPSWLLVLAAGLAGLTIFAWMQANRTILNTGGGIQGWGKDGFSMELLIAPFESDLNTYRTFYSMVTRYPSRYEYIFGKSFLYTLVLFIPRVIWPGKPDNPSKEIIEHSLNVRAKMSGTAVANIGEFYVNFGILGICIGMFILGRAAVMIKRRFLSSSAEVRDNHKTKDNFLMYAILYPLWFQWIARGNFSGNFYMTIFAMLPFICQSCWKALMRRRK